jgi:hypothetical protein
LEEVRSFHTKIDTLVAGLALAEVRRLREKFDCWQSNNRTRIESQEFKEALVTYYQCSSPDTTSTDLMCMVTQKMFPRNEVIGSHIVKHATQGTTMHLYGLGATDIDSPRNGFLVLKSIEEAFDRKELCFLYDPSTQTLHLKVLNGLLLDRKLRKDLACMWTFKLVDNLVLKLPVDVFPFRRCLSMHAKLSFSKALSFKWIEHTAVMDTYFELSETGLQEPLGLGDITWQEVHGEIYSTNM